MIHLDSTTLWLNDGNLSFTVLNCPNWPNGFRFYFHENGGRRKGEVLDLNLQVGHWAFSITFWNLKWVSILLKYVPVYKIRFGIRPKWEL